jgi:Ni,Fe-hydrogenase III large subunit
VCTHDTGDVYGRAYVRWREVQASGDFLLEHMAELADPQNLKTGEPKPVDQGPLMAETLTVSLVEGWRGEICHVAITDEKGRIRRYKIVDPSFHNWFGLALALRNQAISDFPLCNKSFNLSYCGFDL